MNKKDQKSWLGVIPADVAFRQLPYVFFVAALGIMYIWNSHLAERNMRSIEHLKTEVQEARWKYMSIQSDLMLHSTQSHVEKEVQKKQLGVQEDVPYIIRKR